MKLVYTKYKFVADILFVIFWVVGVTPFFISETVGWSSKLQLIEYLISEVAILGLGLWLMRSWKDITVLVSFLILAFISTCIINHNSLFFYLNGIRLYIGFIFVIPIIRYLFSAERSREYFLKRMDKYLYWFLWIQVPCMVIQCALYGAFDNVGGSLGWMTSGVISTVIYMVSFYLMVRRWDASVGYISNLRKNWVLLALLLTTLLNETKVSFVYLVFYVILLVPMDKRYIKRVLIMGPILLIVIVGALIGYSSIYGGGSESIKNSQELADYMFGDDELNDWVLEILENDVVDVDEGDYARGVKLYVTPEILSRDPNAPVWGYGIGQFKGGAFAEKSAFAEHYHWFLQGTVLPVMEVWIELGALGLIWYAAMWLLFFLKDKKSVIEPRLMIYSIVMMLIVSFYAICFTYMVFCIIYFYIMMASINWQYFRNLPVCKLTIPLFTEYTTIPINKEER